MRQSSVSRTLKVKKSAISSLVLLAVSQHGWAAEDGRFNYTIRATAQYEGIENPQRTNGTDTTEQLAQGIISTQLSRQTSRLITDLDYQYSHLDYRKDLLTDRTLTTGSGSLSFIPIRDTLFWDLSHTRSVGAIDASMPFTQDNLQVVKTTTTGPRLTFNLGARNRVNSSYTYTESATTFITIYKQDRTTFDVSVLRQINSAFSAGATYNEFRTVSENSPLASYDRKMAALNSQYLREKYQLYVDVGYIESSSDLSSQYLNVNMTYIPVTDTTIQVTYEDEVEDLFSNLLYARQGVVLDDSTPSLSTNLAQQYKVNRASVSLSHQIANALNYSLQYSTEDREYETATNNQSIDRLGLTFSMPLNDRMTLSAFGRDSDLYFQLNDRMQHRQEYGLSANWLLNTSFSLQFSLNKTTQSGGVLLDKYDTASAMIGFTYTLSN